MNLDVEATVREYLTKTIHMSLGTSRDNKPWVCEVHFAYDDDLNIYFRSAPNRRHSQEIADNPHVAGNIVKQHSHDESPHGIYYEGTAEHMTSQAEREKVFPFFEKQQQAGRDILDKANDPTGNQFYKITVKNWYAFGKFGGDQNLKYELKWNGGKK